MDQDEVKVHKNAKTERGQYPATLTKQTWSIKDLLYGFMGQIFLRDAAGSLEREDGSILLTRVASHIVQFGYPLAELAINHNKTIHVNSCLLLESLS